MWYNYSVMEKYVAPHKQRCKAMVDAGVEDPESAEGILFCAGSRDGTVESRCPYSYCVVFEHEEPVATMKAYERKELAKKLHNHNVSVYDIALILRVSEHSVMRYLRK